MTLNQKLQTWQNDLIDMSRNNNLLYYRTTGRFKHGIQFLDDASSVFIRLAYSQQSIAITTLHTEMDEDELAQRAKRLWTKARDDLNERGVNTLYCAFGMLEWRESDHSDEIVRSPLLLVPVTLARSGVIGSMELKRLGDEEVQVNPTLRAKLENDFRLHVPTYEELAVSFADEAQQQAPNQPVTARRAPTRPSLPWLLSRIERVIPQALNWTVVSELNLSRFSFQKLVMFQDIERHREEIEEHNLLRALGGEADRLRIPADLPSAATLDQHIRPHDSLEILDADSSQQEAILLAKRGISFVLQGPPGTGKSQTIANIIAECLGQGKRVLFVSEKMAALQVVQQRLRDTGLASYCLELHGAHSDKKPFIRELGEAVKQAEEALPADDTRRWAHEADALLGTREYLNAYVSALHEPMLALHMTPFEAYGALARLHGVPDLDFALASVETVTPAQVERLRHLIRQLVEYADVLDNYDTHPWRATLATTYTHELASTIRDHFGRLVAAQSRLEGDLATLLGLVGEPEAELTYDTAIRSVERGQRALGSPLPPRGWFDADQREQARTLTAEAANRAATFHQARARLDAVYDSGVYTLDHDALLRALTDESAPTVAALNTSGEPPHEVALARRDALSAHLTQARYVLERLVPAARRLAELTHLSLPDTLAQVDHLIRLSGCLARSPAPPLPWLDVQTFAQVRAVGLDALEHHATRQALRSQLAAIYQPAYFEFDPRPIARRFAEQYQSLLRFARLQYHQDCRRVRRFLQPGVRRSAAELEDDCRRAAKLFDEEAVLKDRRIQYARLLGHLFDAERTDWERLQHALDWTSDLHRFNAPLPIETQQLAVGAPQGLAPLSAAVREAETIWRDWQHEAAFLSGAFAYERLVPDAAHLDLAPLGALAGALERTHAALSAFWHTADAVIARRSGAASGAAGASAMPVTWSGLCDDLRLAREVVEQQSWFDEHDDALAAALGARYRGLQTEWGEVHATLDWVGNFVASYRPAMVPAALLPLISDERTESAREMLDATLARIRGQLTTLNDEWRSMDSVLPRGALHSPTHAFAFAPLSDLRHRVQGLLDALPDLERWLDCAERRRACEAEGLADLVKAALRLHPFPRDLERIFERRFYALWLDRVLEKTPALRQFRGELHERIIAEFRQRDRRHAALARGRLRAQLAQRRCRALALGGTARTADNATLVDAVAAVKKELTRKRHESIRAIVRRITPALVELKPCWMMSPLSVSQFIESGASLFDLVIFDEASQVSAEDAICAILRGKQLIVVGDSQQLPPTRFFAKSLADAEDDDEEGEDREEERRAESILDECRGVNLTERSLRWHYRSRHESLIAFSNAHFYGNRLVTFPGPDAEHSAGVSFEYVADGVYDRSKSRTNRREAERVADLVFAHARAHATLKGLGVVALSQAQQQAIRDTLEARVRRNPELARWENEVAEDDPAGFFVKNLETVQGDERDTIILSVGYGPDAPRPHGRILTNFGPVNRTGGERRLNVAVSRARERLILVASMRGADLPANMASPGARILRSYLEYAEQGPDVLAQQVLSDPQASVESRLESPFEASVYAALTAKGLEIDTQVGCSGYRIDLAVRDPNAPGRYLLGVECDGATYHSSATARDRDRLRQRHLELMGWTIHRIWSRDWVLDPHGQTLKVLQRLDAIRGADEPEADDAEEPEEPAELEDLAEGGGPSTPVVAVSVTGRDTDRAVAATPAASGITPRATTASPGRPTQLVHNSRMAPTVSTPIEITSGQRMCETCGYCALQTATRFMCKSERVFKMRSPTGVTAACRMWHPR